MSAIALGTMIWGEQNTEAEGHAQLDRAVDFGVTLIDTAESYSIPPRAETQGSTERIIGGWLKARGWRDRIVLASKVSGPSDRTYLRADGSHPRLDARNITEAVEGSLRLLQTDYLDLYQIHWPNRPVALFGSGKHAPSRGHDASEVPIEETLDALDGLVKSGKVRHVGLSNETAWGLSRFLHLSETQGLPRVASVQNAFNLSNRIYGTGPGRVPPPGRRGTAGVFATGTRVPDRQIPERRPTGRRAADAVQPRRPVSEARRGRGSRGLSGHCPRFFRRPPPSCHRLGDEPPLLSPRTSSAQRRPISWKPTCDPWMSRSRPKSRTASTRCSSCTAAPPPERRRP